MTRKKIIIIIAVVMLLVLVALVLILNNSKTPPAPVTEKDPSTFAIARTDENPVIENPQNIAPAVQKNGPANTDIVKQVGLYASNGQITVGEMAFFENNQWVVAPVTSKDSLQDGFTAVMRYDGNKWIPVIDGPGYSKSDVRSLVPASVYTYYLTVDGR